MTRFVRFGVAVLALGALTAAGCQARASVPFLYPQATATTRTQSPHEHFQSVSDIAAHDERLLIDDLDLLFLTDRPSRLTRWQTP